MKNIVLIGFMGTGKTSTGRLLANRLGRAFVDLDSKIEEEEGRTIPEIFKSEGEPYFRAREKDMVKRMAARRGSVISTGGGTIKDAANVAELKRNGCIVCLAASVDAVLERTAHAGSRPVLDREDKGDRRRAVEALMEERRALYEVADYTVDTSDLSPLQVADDIIAYLKREGVFRA
ncbi:shikimate kinase [Selenomonas sputigena]|uniref:Shikimate kinase n=1 Tax=Selenomonas sputigena TaxID=69823 RepID=A0ABV3X758_9FIRM